MAAIQRNRNSSGAPLLPSCRRSVRYSVPKLESRKECPTMDVINLLGATLSFGSQMITASIPGKRKIDLLIDLRRVIPDNKLTPGYASNLLGKLGFSKSLIFGRLGRARPAAFSDRQYCRYPVSGWTLNTPLRDVEVVFAVLGRSFSRYEGRFRGKRPGISCLGIF